jgi:hypothetical protein
MRARRIAATTTASVVALLALWASPAFATFHLMKIREVYPGSLTSPGADYVELQMWSSGQNFVGGHTLRTYTAGGVATKTILPSDVPNGANQSTIVIATPEAESQFGIVADEPLAGSLEPGGGAVCWEEIDCVSWGSFSGMTTAPAGSPAAPAGIPDGMALRRKITPGCGTLLEPEDDHNDSATDFEVVFPSPRPNSVAPTEHPCSTGGGGPPGGGGGGAPQTTLRRKPPRKTADRTPTFRFSSDQSEASFECRLDGKPFRACRSPFTTRKLGFGRHTFRVRATIGSGDLVDATPAAFSFRVVKPR